jgi:hypothetical protein
MPEQQSIKDTLEVIRKALEEDDVPNISNLNDNVLVLNQLVKEDGTINIIEDSYLSKEEILLILNKKLDEQFEKYFNKWLDNNLPKYLEKFIKNKKF